MTRALVGLGAVETRLLVLDGDDEPLDAHIDRPDAPPVAGSRAVGRVLEVDRGLDALFVEIGLDRPGLLPRKAGRDLGAGDPVPVEITRAPPPGKGARLARADGDTAGDGPVPRWLAQRDIVADILRDTDPATIAVEGSGGLAALRRRVPELADRMAAHTGAVPLFESAGVDGVFNDLLAPDVPVPGGGALRIEPVTSLTAIDVDTGGREALDASVAAAAEVARQIRLRALAGLNVVDFPTIEQREQRRRVTDTLTEALASDRVHTDISAMRASGLVELTRQRERAPLHEVLGERCGVDGGGWLPRASTVALDGLRALERAARATPAGTPRIAAAPEVVAALTGALASARADTEARLGRAIALAEEPARARDDVDARMT
ncbi:ribonuclease, Rne/Rng family [Limimonas halophila]|uniref:Ribonuclease, Rne/Rng family n=1 Tax=Limimonas halophila TaxID=1082479 RepID=A0A1G7QM32_9PROT|nr:ribonuclease E/G [Limimonas halophila]SDF99554.1 ribonuclease, Rne/Rng family [Limimonas halophila]